MAQKILVATDGSEHSMKAVRKALEFAEKEGAEVSIISVAYYAKDVFDEMPLNIQSKLESQAQEALAKAKALFDEKGIPVKTYLEAGLVPANNILRFAQEQGFDLIILGSTGISGVMRTLIGSTAAKVVAQAPCSVLVVR
ncbi:MAG: universal stress protein [Thermodesulforhabdaceae bacterium]|jgi:nucleotide-binding universal stress UspA family protein